MTRTPIHARQWRRRCNTAEPSGELSVGDVVAVGEVGLAVGRFGWNQVRGGVNEVRTDEHGTHSLSVLGPSPATLGEPPIDSPQKEPDRP